MMRLRSGRSRRTAALRTARTMVRELPNFFKLVFRLLRDPAISAVDKWLFGAVAAYMLTPVDLLPDFLGVIGWVDDLYLLGLALGRLLTSAGPRRLLRNWDGDPATLGYLVEGVEELGGLMPPGMRRTLRRLSDMPDTVRRRKQPRSSRRVRIDDRARVHVEE
jgi:uncharacterized membrane protein YkvA (DUF1232 family)